MSLPPLWLPFPQAQKMHELNRIAKEMMNDVKKGIYPVYGVTTLAACRPLDVFTRQGGDALAEAQARSAGGAGKLSKEQRDALRNQDPIEGWW